MRGPGGAITGWIDLFSYPLVDQETGAMQGAIEYVRDITAQRRAEEALAEQQWIRENVLDHMNEVIYIVDHDTHEILFVNAAARALLGEGLVGRKCYEAVWSLAAPCHDCGIVALLAGAGASFSREAFSERAGKWLAADVRAVPWLDGRTVFSHVASDTTERKALEEEIIAHNISLNKTVRERTAALEAKNRELEAFAYSVSHDLRAPLRSMEGFSQALLEDYGDRMEAEARHYLERIANGATRLDLLINDLLQYSRLGRNGVAFEPVDTNDVVRGCLDDLREELAASRGAVEVAGPLPTVVADRSLLAILVQNLLANALLYHRDGVPPSVRVSCEERDGAYVFAVADNGLGLDAKYADKAFNMFQRFHAGDKYPGTGIGLANARKVVEAHGGRIWFESTVGEGTTFFFALPVREAGELVAATED
jgi:PAS domain S-box-containing protein